MGDYYSIVARAVRALDPNTGETRRRLYDRARGALLGEMRSAQLALDQSDILTARMSLEDAIAKVETEAQRADATRKPANDVERAAPARSATPRGDQGRGPLTRLWTQMFGRGRDRVESARPLRSRSAQPRDRAAETDPGTGRDTWLTELLARASREEEDGDEAIAPPTKVRRIR